ncbi:hypothetical protein N9O83_01915 [Flavobacteriales bacterium]|nr:hypothetical protein [Flavobacteriales bacterium]
MNCSVEISMYPIDKKYKKHIIEFIKKLRLYTSIKVISNSMSTQVFGEFTDITSALNHEIQLAFKNKIPIVFNLKIINSDLSKIEEF